METLRKRIPFQLSDSTIGEHHDNDNRVLDEQEQDELIETLRAENNASNQCYILICDLVVLLSVFIHIFLAPPLPLPTLLTLGVTLFLHIYLVALLHPVLISFAHPSDLPYALVYTLAVIAPAVCLARGAAWHALAWSCLTPAVVFIVHSAQSSISQGNESLAKLEAMRYVAPGA